MADPSFLLRLPEDELAALDAWQKAKGHKSRNIAAREALKLGMQEARPAAPAMPLAHTPANLPRPAGLTERQLRPEPTLPPEIPGVAVKRPTFTKLDTSFVTYAGDVDRRPMQRGGPKGRKLGE